MRKIFLITALILTIFGSNVFASDEVVLPVIQKQKLNLHPVEKSKQKQ